MTLILSGTNGLSDVDGDASTPAIRGTDGNTGIYFPAADNIAFTTGGTIRGRWTTDGLCFNADTAAANALDDYEEGTWTPVVADNYSSGNTATGTFSGTYIKVGRAVTCNINLTNINTTGMTAGNVLVVRSLPFTSADDGVAAIGTVLCDRITFADYVNAYVLPNGTALDFRESVSGNADTNLLVSDVTVSGTTDMFISFTYFATT
jgi:hypothetical protein